MAILGMDERQYRNFVRAGLLHCKVRPGEPTAFLVIPFLIQLVIGVGLSYLATLLAPKPRAPQQTSVANNQVQGQNVVNGARFTPKNGFDSVQNVVELGSVIPIVYANRQVIDGVAYGGVRVNTNLLWSQIYSIGGGQLLRALFCVGEADIDELDPGQFAIGNNLISNYDLQIRDSGRIAIYYSPDGGRLVGDDHIAGVLPANDLGNAETAGGTDVFQVRGPGGEWTTDFSFTSSPSNQTTFGIHSFIGNNFGAKVNPIFRPAVQLIPGDTGQVRCPNDWQAQAQRDKQNVMFSTRSGIVGAEDLTSFDVGDQFTYTLFTSSDVNREFIQVNPLGADGVETCNDIAQRVAGTQRGWDEALGVGEIYRVGSCVAICVDRTEQMFESEADGSSRQVSATFEVLRPGQAHVYAQGTIEADGGQVASRGSHLYKFAEGSFSTDREARVIEVGLKSTVQLNINGLCNFRDTHSYNRCDNEACFDYNGQQAQNINNIIFQSGTYTSPETRYSFFKISYRTAGTNEDYVVLDPVFGVRSATGVAVYNYLRFESVDPIRWELRFTPVSSWEIRTGTAGGSLEVLDSRLSNIRTVDANGLQISFTGEQVDRNRNSFSLLSLTAVEAGAPGPPYDDEDFYGDAWARIAEAFIYSEMTTTASSPEHSIAYVNCIAENPSTPNYDDIALVGMNIRSSTEIKRLDQFSVYVNRGVNSTSRFPDVLYDLLTNRRYGSGNVLNPLQVDRQSFEEAAEWTTARRYFFDGAVSEKINLRNWGAETARNFLLDLVIRNGRFALQPAVTFGGPETITGLYTAGNIIEDSFEMSSADLQDRVPIRVSVKWRQERESSDIESRGLFPVVREVTVREVGTREDAPLVQIDLSDYATSQLHAIDRAKFEIRTRRINNHSIKFKTTPMESSFDIGSIFKLGLETVSYDQPQNGCVAADGTVTAWPPLADGTYPVLLWDGTVNQIQEVDLTITAGKANRKGVVFCLRNATNRAETYKTQSVTYDEEGNIDVEALYYPTDETGTSLITEGWNVAANWVIEGAL